MSKLVRLVIAGLVLAIGGFALAQLRLVTSIAPYGDLARELGGGLVEVTVILPPGASPHTFEPTPRDAALLNNADLVILNGGTDEWLHEMVEAVNEQVRVVEALTVLEGVLPDLGGEDDAVSDEPRNAHDHGHFGVNPHVWLDPLLMRSVVEAISQALAELDPDNSRSYSRRAGELVDELAELDRELRETLAPVAGAPFIPLHDAWPYFAERYSLDLIIEIEPFPGREPSPRYLASVVDTIRQSGAPAIFSEAGLSDRAARVLADEAGVELHRLDPLGTQQESYQDLLRRNAITIREALSAWEQR